MKQLPSQVRKNRYDYKLVKRTSDPFPCKNVAIYSQHDTEGLVAYEVFIIPIRKKDIVTPSGIVAPAGEVFPGNETFGTNAYSIHSLSRAKERFDELIKQIYEESLVDHSSL